MWEANELPISKLPTANRRKGICCQLKGGVSTIWLQDCNSIFFVLHTNLPYPPHFQVLFKQFLGLLCLQHFHLIKKQKIQFKTQQNFEPWPPFFPSDFHIVFLIWTLYNNTHINKKISLTNMHLTYHQVVQECPWLNIEVIKSKSCWCFEL